MINIYMACRCTLKPVKNVSVDIETNKKKTGPMCRYTLVRHEIKC